MRMLVIWSDDVLPIYHFQSSEYEFCIYFVQPNIIQKGYQGHVCVEEFLVYDMPRWHCILFHIISIVILFRIANAAVGWRILYHSFRETYCYEYICIHISNIYCKRNSNTRYKISFSCFWVWYTHRILLLYVTGVFCTLYVHSGWVFLLPNVYAEQFHTYIYRGHIFSLSILCQGRFGCRGEWKSLAHAMCVRILLFFFVSLESS